MSNPKLSMVFFGGEPLGLPSLKALCAAGLTPDVVVCNPDRARDRGQTVKFSPIKAWALEHGLTVVQPTTYKETSGLSLILDKKWDLFVVVAYNFILPKWFLELPTHGVINVHPSLLPKLRGASPIRTAILEDLHDQVGVSIMLMDEKMDHGPILSQQSVVIEQKDWPIAGHLLDEKLARIGGDMLATTIPRWLQGVLTPTEQEHVAATYTKKFEKADSELFIDPINLPSGEEALSLLLKIKAFAGMFDTFFMDNGKRIKIKEAAVSKDGSLTLLRVLPEGRKEIDFTTYLASR